MLAKYSGGNPPYCPYSRDLDKVTEMARCSGSPSTGRIVRKGHYFRADDSRWVPRFRCLDCDRTFSSSRLTPCFGQKRRTINSKVASLLISGVSQRRAAILLRINRKTAIRKFVFTGNQAGLANEAENEALVNRGRRLDELQFDEMESFERSKCLPLSIPIAVDPKTRRILGFQVGEMPAKGPLAPISRKKYGPRNDLRPQMASALFKQVSALIAPTAVITTDQNPKYPGWLKPHFPEAIHRTVKGRRGCVVGQGELKKIGNDPLFALNHSAAMIRANINRMFRRTWCTTKRADRLNLHLNLYVYFHNTMLIHPPAD
jgi:transposase-like protein